MVFFAQINRQKFKATLLRYLVKPIYESLRLTSSKNDSSHLNSILLVIDAVCTSTEAAFADDSCKSLSPISPEILINHPFASQSVSNPSDSTASKGLTRVSAVRHPHPHSSSSTSVSLASQAVASLQRISETPLRSASSRIDDGNICYGTSSLSHATSGVGVARPLAGVDIPANRNLCKLQSFPEPCQLRNQPLEHLFRSASAMSYLVAASPKPKFNLMDNSFPIMPTRRACSSCQGSLTNSKDLEDGVDGGGVSLFTDPSAKRHPEEAEISTRTPQSPSLRQVNDSVKIRYLN
ncbi:unnamed protein product [Protopolystoma xenopodis]|uniref:Uncharacterized protein n=1 Tax=Protopolystoma xenopodis TaxID=117903 RepID=A0A448WMU4_9PLAT|nr:unnamed protein product [Protopolystoma xenopodis]